MTDEESRALDFDVAERIMGWRRCELARPLERPTDDGGSISTVSVLLNPEGPSAPVPHYSTDWTAAGLVVEHLRKTRSAEWSIQSARRGWVAICTFWGAEWGEGYARCETPMEAICRAGLEAAGGHKCQS